MAMDPDRRLLKALDATNDALQHLCMSPDFGSLDCTHIDRLLARVVDLPTEGNQRNSRRNLLVIRQWMITEGPGVVLLEVLGQLYWRLGELNAKQFEKFKATLQQQQAYLSLIRDTRATTLVTQRIRHIQRSKSDACQEFLCELSDFSTLKVDSPMAEIEALQEKPNSPFSPASAVSLESCSSQETGFVSLIKNVPTASLKGGDIDKFLIDFYINGICPGRTIAQQSNTYHSILKIANTCESTRYALLSLSASYICEYICSEKEKYHQAELFYATQALQALARQISNGENYDAALATSMLLMHHDAVNNNDEASLCWSCHANVFDTIPSSQFNHHSDAALFMRTQLVLARTAQTSFQFQSTSRSSLESMEWYTGTPSNEGQKISGILGLSPHLIFLISSITSLAADSDRNRVLCYQALEKQLNSLRQWSTELQGQELEVLHATAEAFRLAALIYLRARLFGFTRFHPAIAELNDTLCTVLMSLPVKGPLYTAIYPIWPLFVACVTANSDKRDCLYQRVVPIREGDKNTLPAVLKRVSGMRIWLARQDMTEQRRDGWWDEMLAPSSSTTALPTNRLLCLG